MANIKKATTIEQQIKILEKRGITIADLEKAKENLLDIGYFRLGFYCFPFEKSYPKKIGRDHQYVEGTLFDDVVKLYYFDVDLRNLLMRYIYRIEINFRTYLIYTVSNKYINSPTWFVDSNVVSASYIKNFDIRIYNDAFKKNQVIKCHHRNHINDRYAPAWKTIEFMTFGNILVLYESLKDQNLKSQIAKHYGFSAVSTFNNYMKTVCVIRNACAHSNVLLDIALPCAIKNGPADNPGTNKNKLVGATSVIKYMTNKVSCHRAIELEEHLNQLLENNKVPESVKIVIEKCSGFKFSLTNGTKKL